MSATQSTADSSPTAAGAFVVPVSFAQERLWFLNQLEPDSPFYNVPLVIPLRDPVNTSALAWALNALMARHESLRTTFRAAEPLPLQVIAPQLALTLHQVDLRQLSAEQGEHAANEHIRREAQRPFDLRTGPLVRATLLLRSTRDHLLLLTLHHIVCDGWSLGILLKEFQTLYTARCRHQSVSLPELSIQYADFAHWQREQLQGKRLESLLHYWTEHLAGAPAVLELPTDKSRPRVQSFRGATESFSLAPELTVAIRALSRRCGVTVFMALLAVFKTLLMRYTGSEDIVVGTPIANRNRAELEGVVGFFANTVVLRSDLSGNPTFEELLQRVSKVTLAAYDHQDMPFEQLVSKLQSDRYLSHNPLFQVMFALQNMPTLALAAAVDTPETRELFEPKSSTAKFDLGLFMGEEEHRLVGGLEYCTDLFERQTVLEMLAHFCAMLESVVADPQQRVRELAGVTSVQRQQLLTLSTTTEQPCRLTRLCYEEIENRARELPQAIAVMCGEKQLTYQALDQQANALAHLLREHGVGPDCRVGVCLGRSLEGMIAPLAIHKAGGVYVPLDPDYPAERLAYMVETAELEVVLTNDELATQVEHCHSTILRLSPHMLAERADPPRREVGLDHLAFVVFTSGSTGWPKAVALPHRTLVNLVERMVGGDGYAAPVRARTLQFAALSFDVSVQEIFTTWYSGGMLVVASNECRHDMRRLLNYLHDHHIERIHMPPVVLQQLAETGGQAWVAGSQLREVIVGGEPLHITAEIRQFFQGAERCRLVNHYGPSETHVVTEQVLAGGSEQWETHPAIGRPIAGSRVYILDDRLHLVPRGVPGEIYLSGQSVSRCYLNHPRLTAEKFLPDLFAAKAGARMYKTGDLARFRPDGTIAFLSRVDHQVKLRGLRIELGEIDAVLVEHPKVSEAVTMMREDTPGNKRLVSYVVPARGAAPTVSMLHRFLRQWLPVYMLPSDVVFLERIPVTTNGKVDRQALPAPARHRPDLDTHYVPPRTAVEQALAEMWQELLKVTQVGVEDNFFELGGNSLLATQLISRIEAKFGIDLPVRELFDSTTIADLATRVVSYEAAQLADEQRAEILAALEEMPEEEAAALLEGQNGAGQ